MPTDPTIAESDTARSDSHARAPGPRNGQARWFGVRRRLRPLDRAAAGRALVVVLVVAIGCWYFGLDPWHAILIGTACALAWVAVYGPSGREVASAG